MTTVRSDSDDKSYDMRGEYVKEATVSVVERLPHEDTEPSLAVPKQPCRPDDWPAQPAGLHLAGWKALWITLYDLALIIAALALIAKTSLCIYAYKLDNKMPAELASSLSTNLVLINDQMTTLFTVIFIVIMATAVRRYALWKAQRGAYVSDLEQLQSSISFTGTIKTVFTLRKFTLTSFALVLIWSFFYLGSQASGREYVFTNSDVWRSGSARFPTKQAQYPFSANQSSESMNAINKRFLQNTYSDDPTGSFSTPGVDELGNALIPIMEYDMVSIVRHGNTDSKAASPLTDLQRQQWMKVYPIGEEYTSVEGLRLKIRTVDLGKGETPGSNWVHTGAPDGERVVGEYSFSSSIFNVQCGQVDILPPENFPQGVMDFMRTSLNMTSNSDATSSGSPQPQTFNVWHRWNETYSNNDQSVNLNGQNSGVLRIGCNVTRPEVRAKVFCGEKGCVVSKIQFPASSNAELFQTPFRDEIWAAVFFDNFLWALGSKSDFTTGTKADELLNLNLLIDDLQDQPSSSILQQSVKNVGYSTAKWINTYFNMALNDYLNPPDETDVSDPDRSPAIYTSTSFRGALYDPKYRIFWPWLIIDYMAGGILLVASVYSYWLRKRTLAPDIFGFVSSLTRDNPYVPVVPGGSTLSGMDRAVAMNRVKIRIADVGTDGEYGKVGIVAVTDEIAHAPLNKHRKYL